MALKHVYYHVRNELPVYVQYRIQDAWGWCTGMIQRDDMGWEMGGGFKIGNSRTPVADSFRGEVNFLYYIRHQNKFHTDQYINIKNKCVILLKQNIGVSV